MIQGAYKKSDLSYSQISMRLQTFKNGLEEVRIITALDTR